MKNVDSAGDPLEIPDSVETAIRELIEDEKAGRIIVVSSLSHYSNAGEFGACWQDAEGRGVSGAADTTYKECANISDDSPVFETAETPGPVFPQVTEMVRELASKKKVTFTSALGEREAFGDAVVTLLQYAIEKEMISGNSSLKVVLAASGLPNNRADGERCDIYYDASADLKELLGFKVESYLASNWSSDWRVEYGETIKAQPDESGNYDPPTIESPTGQLMSTGEAIDARIYGSYISQNGLFTTNLNGFDYIVVLPVTWIGDNLRTLLGYRQSVLGNHHSIYVDSEERWVRQTDDQDGSQYDPNDPQDYDEEFFTVRQMDASGWASAPASSVGEIGKGTSGGDTTNVIVTGSFLSVKNALLEKRMTDMTTASIVDAVLDPDINGKVDRDCN
jgi:hypothetical protein